MRPAVPLSRLLAPAAIITLPAVGLMGILWLAGTLPFGLALTAAVASVAATAVLLHGPIADIMAVAAYARTLTRGHDAEPPALSAWGVGNELSGAIVELRRSWAQKNAEQEALLRSNDIILDSLPDPLLLLGRGRRVVRANLAARALFQRDLQDRNLASVLRDPDLLEAADAALTDRMGGTVTLALPLPVRRDYQARIEPLPLRTSEGATAVLVLMDVTTMSRTQQMRVDFIANVSHELRTPLSALAGFIETLQGPARDDPDARDRFLPIMADQTRRMTRLVGDLLSLSRIELDEHTQPEGRVDLAEVVSAVVETFELKANEKTVKLTLTAGEGVPRVIGDADQLTQVVTNLVDNAIKYTRPGTEITIAVALGDTHPAAMPRNRDGAVVLTVRDQGEGMAQEHLPRLTERFYRVDAARSRELGGTGLGLAIVKHVVNRHRGTLHIDSEVGQGSTVTVHLPCHPIR